MDSTEDDKTIGQAADMLIAEGMFGRPLVRGLRGVAHMYYMEEGGNDYYHQALMAAIAEIESLQLGSPVGFANGNELDNMLDDRTATIQGEPSNFRRVPLYRKSGPKREAPKCGTHSDLYEAMVAIASYSDAPHVDPAKRLRFIQETARAILAKAGD